MGGIRPRHKPQHSAVCRRGITRTHYKAKFFIGRENGSLFITGAMRDPCHTVSRKVLHHAVGKRLIQAGAAYLRHGRTALHELLDFSAFERQRNDAALMLRVWLERLVRADYLYVFDHVFIGVSYELTDAYHAGHVLKQRRPAHMLTVRSHYDLGPVRPGHRIVFQTPGIFYGNDLYVLAFVQIRGRLEHIIAEQDSLIVAHGHMPYAVCGLLLRYIAAKDLPESGAVVIQKAYAFEVFPGRIAVFSIEYENLPGEQIRGGYIPREVRHRDRSYVDTSESVLVFNKHK